MFIDSISLMEDREAAVRSGMLKFEQRLDIFYSVVSKSKIDAFTAILEEKLADKGYAVLKDESNGRITGISLSGVKTALDLDFLRRLVDLIYQNNPEFFVKDNYFRLDSSLKSLG